MRTLFGISIIAVALVITSWSVEPPSGKPPPSPLTHSA